MNMTSLRYIVAVAALMLMTFPVNANTIVPGQTVSPDVFTLSTMPPLLGETTGTFSLATGGGNITGTYTDAVLVDPFGVTCAGCLDFAIQVTVNSGSPGAIQTVFDSGLRPGGVTPAAVDVGYVQGTGNVAPSTVNYGPAGVDMGFNLASPLTAGESTDFLLIATSATIYNSINVSAAQAAAGGAIFQLTGSIGANTATDIGTPSMSGNFFAPAVTTPEPSTLLLTFVGLLGLMGIAFRHKRLA
jgi:hypothetical protein